MIRILIILYFVVGLCMDYVGTSKMETDLKKCDLIPFFLAQVVFILFWPLCLLLASGGNDDED